MDPELFRTVAFLHLMVFLPHAMFISARETNICLSEMGFNSIRWFILLLLDFCFFTKLLEVEEEQMLAQMLEYKHAAAIPEKKEKRKKSTWFECIVPVLCCTATCAFLIWGAVNLYRFGIDPIKRTAYCVMVMYPAPFLWCMKKLCNIKEEDVKTQKQLKSTLYCSLSFMISNDTFCYGILGAGMTIYGAAILAIVVFALSVWSCFFLTTDLADDDEKHEHNSDRHIGNILSNTAIYLLMLWGVISLYQFSEDGMFLRATYCLTILSPIPFIQCVKIYSYESAELRRVPVKMALNASLAFMCSCGAFCLSIVYNVVPDADLEDDTIFTAVVLAFLAFVTAFTCGFFVEMLKSDIEDAYTYEQKQPHKNSHSIHCSSSTGLNSQSSNHHKKL